MNSKVFLNLTGKYLLASLIVFFVLTDVIANGRAGISMIEPASEESPPTSKDTLRLYESKLKAISDTMLDGSNQEIRTNALRQFIPKLVKTLQLEGSFEYPFDSLKFMRILSPPDNSFRFYNWLLGFDDGTFRYYGAIHLNDPDSFRLFPLFDGKERLGDNRLDTIVDHRAWRGALYYDIIQTGRRRAPVYTFIGWDGNNPSSQIKLLEVLSFADDGTPRFGAPIFKVRDKEDDEKTHIQHRAEFEYSARAVMSMRRIKGRDVVVFDHLVPIEPDQKGKYNNYVPDGSLDYFIFNNGMWIQSQNPYEEIRGPLRTE